MKLFITGSQGMLGRNLVSLAEQRGYDVLSPSRKELDLTNQSQLKLYLEKNKPDVVIHCAGLVGGIQANMASPYDFCYQNLYIGLNIVQASFDAGIKKLINLSSAAIYPKDATNPLSITQLFNGKFDSPNEGYSLAKLTITKLIEFLNAQHNLSYKTYIPCNLYGYWDKFDPLNGHMIPAVINRIHSAVQYSSKELCIWGDGTTRREFMFAEDLADFILFSLNKWDEVPSTLNVGYGDDYSMNEFYRTIAKVVGYKEEFTYDKSKPTGRHQRILDTTAQQALNWKPKTDLEAGIKNTYQFYLNEVL
ncbi:MAG: GDP-L-fucose synthase [Colwellia sp.]|jgi:GDP-L-fucose synthase